MSELQKSNLLLFLCGNNECQCKKDCEEKPDDKCECCVTVKKSYREDNKECRLCGTLEEYPCKCEKLCNPVKNNPC